MRQVLLSSLLLAATAAPLAAQDAAEPQRFTIPFRDPSRAGSVEVNMVTGSITVKGTSRKDVLIEARPNGAAAPRPPRRRTPDEPPPPGLRRLTQNTPIDIEEDRNTISIDIDPVQTAVDLTIEVPAHTNLELETVKGSVSVDAVDGELEVDSVNGAVTLTNVGGSVVAHTVNGKLTAVVTRAAPQQPMAFTSLNGTVDVTLPASVKANLKLRSDQGDVYTDFDLQPAREGAGNPNPNPDADNSRRAGRRRTIEVDNAIYGSVNGGGPDFEMRTFNGNVYVRKAK